ncbi:MAG: hypothetical protein HYX47_16190 [Burkholderiales bacterium]|nr:hypothetical protein [Burkholderiales bacterium]
MEENTSGHGPMSAVPPEIDRWNWGAFFLNWIWGIGNNTWIALLMFVPFANMVMPFVLGAKGSAWAWRNKKWDSVEHFRRVQRKWAVWSLVAWLAFIALIVAIVFGVMFSMKKSDVYQQAVRQLQVSDEAMDILGAPVTTGWPSGSFNVSGPDGTASFSFDAEGKKASGTVYVEATRARGQWAFDHLELAVQGQEKRIDLDP